MLVLMLMLNIAGRYGESLVARARDGLRAFCFGVPVVGVLAVVPVGCAPDAYEPEIGGPIYEGESFDVWASDGLTACGGTFDYMERWLSDFRGITGPLPTQEHHRFYWLSAEDWAASDVCTAAGTVGCVKQGHSIYAQSIPLEHEVVHAELATADSGVSFLNEGAAEVFGNFRIRSPRMDFDPQALLEFERLPDDQYGTAGHFARFAIDRHGLMPFLDALSNTSSGDDLDAVDGAWEQATGASLELDFAAYADYPSCTSYGSRFDFAYCAAPSIEPEAEGLWSWTLAFECSSPDAIGPQLGSMWSDRTVTISTAGRYSVVVDAPGARGAEVSFQRCDNPCEGYLEEPRNFPGVVQAGQERTYALEAAVYWLRLWAPAETAGPVTVQIRSSDE